MAIIVEDDQRYKTGIVSLLTWVVIVGIVVAAVYYIFFKRVDLIEVALPDRVKQSQALLDINVAPEEVLESLAFKDLKNTIPQPAPINVSRVKPFLP